MYDENGSNLAYLRVSGTETKINSEDELHQIIIDYAPIIIHHLEWADSIEIINQYYISGSDVRYDIISSDYSSFKISY